MIRKFQLAVLLVAGQIGPRSNRPQSNRSQVKSAPCYIYKIKWKYRYLTWFFLPNATCFVLKNDTMFVPSGQTRVQSVILSS